MINFIYPNRMIRIIISATVALLFVILILTGCASFNTLQFIPSYVIASLPNPVATSVAQYRAYGDSITAGDTLSNSEKPYPAFVAEIENVTYANNAILGDQACDVTTRQIFPHEDFPTLATHPTYTLLIGTNDVNVKGVSSYEAVYILCHQAAISWLAVPAEYKVLANGSGMATTGTGTIDSSNNWNAWTTGGLGSTVSFTITTSQAGPIYAWPRIDDDNPGTYTYSLDGVVLGTASIQTTPQIATQNGSTSSLGFLRLPVVAAGTHVVTFTQTSIGANGVSLVGIGTPSGPITDKLPIVLVGTIPFQLHNDSGYGCSISDAPCLEYNQDIEADVNLFAADGLNVRLFDTRTFMFGKAAEMNDAVHPNEFGQYELSHSVEAVW
jgi:hypothetical protein